MGDQRVQAVLRGELLGHVGSAAGECRDPQQDAAAALAVYQA
ncbi:MAG TPA: hypothetical protein VGW74_00325 [Propionibacteriaceae bacterium]|nr:hypothetical protein [Propionibacteriaceae bacterium]